MILESVKLTVNINSHKGQQSLSRFYVFEKMLAFRPKLNNSFQQHLIEELVLSSELLVDIWLM